MRFKVRHYPLQKVTEQDWVLLKVRHYYPLQLSSMRHVSVHHRVDLIMKKICAPFPLLPVEAHLNDIARERDPDCWSGKELSIKAKHAISNDLYRF